MDIPPFLNPVSTDGRLGCFQVLTIINRSQTRWSNEAPCAGHSRRCSLSDLCTCATPHLVQALTVHKTVGNICTESGHRPMCSFFLGKYLGAGWQGHMVAVSSTFFKPLNCFPKQLYHLTSLPATHDISVAPLTHQHLVWSAFWISVFLKWHLTVVFICLSLITNGTEYSFQSAHLLSMYGPWCSVCSSFCPFLIGLFVTPLR